jgi:5-methylcytosine-specific restriction endonuclease McrA
MSYLVPREKGGPDHPDNVVPACARCIHSKGKRTILEWPAARALLFPTVFQVLAARTSALEVKP